jgi:conjugative relaxase-like TrwC/TraI family protein
MVASLHALRTSTKKGGSALDVVNYLMERDTSEYYSENNAVQATWFGAAEDFGLVEGAAIDLKQFENMLKGLDPDGNQFPERAPHPNHMMGVDITISSPKSVSMTRALADGEERAELDRIIFKARQDALAYMVEEGAFVYRENGELKKARPIFGLFGHHGSRAGDMQEHGHCVALNVCKDENGKTHRLEWNPLFRAKMETGAMARCFEAAGLQDAGYTIQRDGSSYEIVGAFTKSQQRIHSKGSKNIAASVGPNASAKSKAIAALDTRGEKIIGTPEETDRKHRDSLYITTGRLPSDVATKIKGQHEIKIERNRPKFDLTEIIDDLSTRGAYFRTSDLKKLIATNAQGCFTTEELKGGVTRRAMAAALKSDRLVPLYSKEGVGGPWMIQEGGLEALSPIHRKQAEKGFAEWERKNPQYAGKYDLASHVSYVQEKWRTDNKDQLEEALAAAKRGKQVGWTTREVLYADQQLAAFAENGGKSPNFALPKELVDKCIADFEEMQGKEIPGFKISEQQRKAVYHITRGGDLSLLEAPAGFGKSTIYYPVARAFEAAGYNVIGVTFQNTNATALGDDADIPTYTLDKFGGLVKVKDGSQRPGAETLKIDDKTIVLLDEAAQVGGEKMYRTVQAVQKAEAKLVGTGHNAQMQAIAGTAAFKLLVEKAGPGVYCYLNETMRQKDKAHGEALTAQSEGDAVEAWIKHAEKGNVHIVEGTGYEDIAALYHRRFRQVGVDKSFVLASTNADMRHINNEIRATLKDKGVVSARDYTVVLTDKQMNEYETELAVGDRIITREKVKGEGAVQNGVVWRITDLDEVEPGRLKIGMERADGKPVDKRNGRMRVEIDSANTKNIHLVYCMTTDLSQGRTKEAGGKHESSAERFENSGDYVGKSRFKDVPDIVIPEHVIVELALSQDVEIKNPLDIKEAAPLLVAASEDMSRRKNHTLDYNTDEKYVQDHQRDEKLFQDKGQREADKIAAEKKATIANNARINAERAEKAAAEGRQAQGRDDTAPLSKDGKLAESELSKAELEAFAALKKTPEQIAADVQAFEQIKAEREAAKQAKAAANAMRAAQQPGKPQQKAQETEKDTTKNGEQLAQPGQQEAPQTRQRRSLAELAAEAKASAQEQYKDEIAGKLNGAAREIGLLRVGRDLDRAEDTWRKLPADAPAEQIATVAAQKEEIRLAYRGLMPDDAARQRWDSRNAAIDQKDAHTPAGQRQAELAAAQAAEQARQAEEARQRAEQARKGPSLSM